MSQRAVRSSPKTHATAEETVSASPLDIAGATPMMAQYIEIKAANTDCLLFYRMGDFYELFFEDAEIASRALGIVLTKRGKHGGADIPMCGVPVERSDDYLSRLIALGHRVAVCAQTEDPAEAKKRGPKSVVRREVVRLVTPGTITEDRLLDPSRASILLALGRRKFSESGYAYGIAAVDISTGRFSLSEVPEGELGAAIARHDPREIVLSEAIHSDPSLSGLWRDVRAPVTPLAQAELEPASAERRIKEQFGVSTLDGFGQFGRAELAAAGAALLYIERTQIGARPALSPPTRRRAGRRWPSMRRHAPISNSPEPSRASAPAACSTPSTARCRPSALATAGRASRRPSHRPLGHHAPPRGSVVLGGRRRPSSNLARRPGAGTRHRPRPLAARPRTWRPTRSRRPP